MPILGYNRFVLSIHQVILPIKYLLQLSAALAERLKRIRGLAAVALILGLAVFTVVIAHEGVRAVVALFAHGGWWLLLLVPIHMLPLCPDVLGWQALIIGDNRFLNVYWIAAVRQAVSRLLPVASIGGELVGISLLRRFAISGRFAAASVVVEVLLTMICEYLFVMLGVACLLRILGNVHIVHALLLGLLVSLPLVVLLAAVIRHGALFERLQSVALLVLGRLLRGRAAGDTRSGAHIDAAIRAICASKLRLLRALGWQFLGLLIGCLETWAALWMLGYSASPSQIIVLQSFTSAARQVLFVIPAGLGVQELSFIAVGQLLGIAGELCVAVSLAKRLTEIVFGIPALVSWQWVLGRKLWTTRDAGRLL